jgi:phage-related protein
MARDAAVPGEKPPFWVGSSRKDLLAFPEVVKDHLGIALSVAQFGGKHPDAKPWKGDGPGVLEIVENRSADTWRAVYTVRFEKALYVLHVFQRSQPQASRPHSAMRI